MKKRKICLFSLAAILGLTGCTASYSAARRADIDGDHDNHGRNRVE